MIASTSTEVLASTTTLASHNAEFFLGFITLAISVIAGIVIMIDWMRHHQGHDHPLRSWGAGLFFTLWFQIPLLIANAGVNIVVSDFNVLFSVMTPISLLGSLLILRSIFKLSGSKNKYLSVSIGGIFVLCSAYMGFFYHHPDAITSVASIIGGAIFFITLFTIMLIRLIKWFHNISLYHYPLTGIGIALLITASSLQLAATLAGMYKVLSWPPQFWFAAIMSSTAPFLLQSLSVMILIGGFYLIHREQMPHHKKTN